MIKPEYITFSQETFDECEDLRTRVLADRVFATTQEYRELAIKLADAILSTEYGRYLDELQGAEKQ